MALYAIGDLHLSLTADKSMEVFGPAWENYTERIGELSEPADRRRCAGPGGRHLLGHRPE